jgi:hypothetical protein
MKTRRITHQSTEVTQFATAAGFNSKLLEIKTPEGAFYRFVNPMSLILKLLATGGAQIPANSKIFVFKRAPGADFGQFIRMIAYSPYFDLTESLQRDVRFRDATMHDLGAGIGGIDLPEDYTLEVWIESPVVVDLTETGTRFEVIAIEMN